MSETAKSKEGAFPALPSGILPVNKPEGFTSFDVIAKLRGILKMKRLGHAGTLDPMATGVLPVFVGTATKACDLLPDSGKVYEAGFQLGLTTDTQDSTGAVLERRDPSSVTEEAAQAALSGFRGEISQVPPMYSAVKVGGKRLYELARQGREIPREARPITVEEFSLLEFDSERKCGKVRIACSKGTYIRTLLHDWGQALGCGGVMTSLVRTRAAGISLEVCLGLPELEAMPREETASRILPVAEVFRELPAVRLDKRLAGLYQNGVKLRLEQAGLQRAAASEPGMLAVYGPEEFLGVARVEEREGVLRSVKSFWPQRG